MLGALDSVEEREADEPEPMRAHARASSILLKRTAPFSQQPFAAAIEGFSKRSIVPRETFDALTDAAKQRSFTVAGLAVEELLGDAHAELDRQLKASPEHTYKDPDTGKWVYKGPNLREFRGFVEERLESAGWTPANPSHIETIFRTNLASAYSTGRVAEMTQPAVLKLRPYWQIITVHDGPPRQRKTHYDAHGVVLPADHPFWLTAFPPFGYNCRCRVISRSQKWVDAHGGVSQPPRGLPDPGFASGTHRLLVSPEVLKEFQVKSSPVVTPLERVPRPVEPIEQWISPVAPEPNWPKPPPLPKPKAPPKPKGPLTSGDIMHTQLSGAKGSNPGGLYRGKDGKERYVKLYADPVQGQCEHLANQIYTDLGLGRVKSTLFQHAGKTAYASEIVQGATPIGQVDLTPELARTALEGLVGDLVTANWDAAGLTLDNMVVTKAGKVLRIDNGGTFLMRAKGGRKPEALLEQLTEWDGFFSPSKNPAYAKLASIAGVKGPADLLPIIKKQLARLEAIQSKAGGWLSYVSEAAPELSPENAKTIAEMLAKRTELIGEKILETEKLIAEQKAAAKAAAKAAKTAPKAAPKAPAVPPIPGTPKPGKFEPWRASPATLKEAVDRLPSVDVSAALHGTHQPTSQAFRDRMTATVKAVRTVPTCEEGIRSYTGSNYGRIRLAERVKSGRLLPGDADKWSALDKRARDYLSTQAEQLEEAHRRVAHLPRPHEGYTLYRGIRLKDAALTEVLNKAEVVFGGTGSTSFSASTAASFGDLHSALRESWSVLFEIGSHKTGIAVDFLSANKGESEVIFPASARFRILEVRRIEGKQRALLLRVEEM